MSREILKLPLPADLRVPYGREEAQFGELWLPESGGPLTSQDPLRLAGAVALAGVVDLRRAWELRLSNAVVNDLLGGSPTEVGERYRSASPFDLLPLGVPQVLIHGTDDVDVPLALSERYHQAALAVGERCELVVLVGAGHFEVIDPGTVEWPRVLAAVSLLTGESRAASRRGYLAVTGETLRDGDLDSTPFWAPSSSDILLGDSTTRPIKLDKGRFAAYSD